MSMCAGKIECEIYRDKKYCKASENKLNMDGECKCNHAVYLCYVDTCYFSYNCTGFGPSERLVCNMPRGVGK